MLCLCLPCCRSFCGYGCSEGCLGSRLRQLHSGYQCVGGVGPRHLRHGEKWWVMIDARPYKCHRIDNGYRSLFYCTALGFQSAGSLALKSVGQVTGRLLVQIPVPAMWRNLLFCPRARQLTPNTSSPPGTDDID